MQQRFDIRKQAPEAFPPLMAFEQAVRQSGLEPRLAHLVKIRASQINGCAFCLDMHGKEARASGLSEQWVGLMGVWRESPLYDERERAVLAFVEEVTLCAETHIGDACYAELARHFDVPGITKLLVAICAINMWNRVSLAQRLVHPVDRPASAAA